MPHISDKELLQSTQKLKQQLEQLSAKQKSLQEHVHGVNNKANTILASINGVLNIIASALSGNKHIPLPLVGFITDMIAVIPQSGAILTDPSKSLSEKIIAGGILGAISALTITVFVAGAGASAIISSVIAASNMFMEGLSLFGLGAQKYATKKALQLRSEFDALVAQNSIPESERYNELFELRAVELQHQLMKPLLNATQRQQLDTELKYIDQILAKKGLIIGAKPEGAAKRLIALYKEREDKMAVLVAAVAQVNPENSAAAQTATITRDEVVAIDQQIRGLNASQEYLNTASSNLNSKLALGSSTVAMSMAGLAFSVLGVLLTVGLITAPPLLVPVMLGIGITMSVLGLLKWGAEKYDEYQDNKQAKAQLAQQQHEVLHEAVAHCEMQKKSEHNAQPDPQPQPEIKTKKDVVLPKIAAPEGKRSRDTLSPERQEATVNTALYKEKLSELKHDSTVTEASEIEQIKRTYSLGS